MPLVGFVQKSAVQALLMFCWVEVAELVVG